MTCTACLQTCTAVLPCLQAAEQSDDFRLNVALMRACMDDKAQASLGWLASQSAVATSAAGAQLVTSGSCCTPCASTSLSQGHVKQASTGARNPDLIRCWVSRSQFASRRSTLPQFCEGVAPGEANVKDCLELHM